MAEIAVAGGIVLDVATKEDLAEHHERLKVMFPSGPEGRYYSIAAQLSTTSGFTGSGPVALVFEPKSPPGGRMWRLQWVAVFIAASPAAGATANLFASVMVGRAPYGPNQSVPGAMPGGIVLDDVKIPGQAVPSSINVPDLTIVKSQAQLYVVLQGSGLAASSFYAATAGVLDVPDQPEAYFW